MSETDGSDDWTRAQSSRSSTRCSDRHVDRPFARRSTASFLGRLAHTQHSVANSSDQRRHSFWPKEQRRPVVNIDESGEARTPRAAVRARSALGATPSVIAFASRSLLPSADVESEFEFFVMKSTTLVAPHTKTASTFRADTSSRSSTAFPSSLCLFRSSFPFLFPLSFSLFSLSHSRFPSRHV